MIGDQFFELRPIHAPLVHPPREVVRGVVVNGAGERFINEDTYFGHVGQAILAEQDLQLITVRRPRKGLAGLLPHDAGIIPVVGTVEADFKFERVGVFPYSLEPGTPAEKLTVSDSNSSYSDLPSRCGPGSTSRAPTMAAA